MMKNTPVLGCMIDCANVFVPVETVVRVVRVHGGALAQGFGEWCEPNPLRNVSPSLTGKGTGDRSLTQRSMRRYLRNQSLGEAGGNLLAGLLRRTQTAGANVHPHWFVLHHERRGMNIGHPPPLAVTVGMADPVTGGGGFSTNITLQFRYFLQNGLLAECNL